VVMKFFEESIRNAGVRYLDVHSAFGQRLDSLFNLGVDVTMVSPNNYFNFTPLLAGCAVGTLEFRCAVEPVSLREH
jgi:NADH dehydrogenase FAD-containing subunit